MAHRIGPFLLAQLGRTSIPDTVRLVATSGYAREGDAGAGLYRLVATEPSHPAKFQDSGWRWFELSPYQTIVPEMFGALGDGTSDDRAALQAALEASVVTALTLLAATYAVGSPLLIPGGRTLQGAGRGLSAIRALGSYGPTGPGASAMLSCLPEAEQVVVRDLRVDGGKLGIGDAAKRLCLVDLAGRRLTVERVDAANGSGSAFRAGGEAGLPCSGRLADLRAENWAVLFETSNRDGVRWEQIEGANGDGDIAIEAVIRTIGACSDVAYRNVRFAGAALTGVDIDAGSGPMARIAMEGCEIAVDGPATALRIGGGDGSAVDVTRSRFVSSGGTGLRAENAVVRANHALFEGAVAVQAGAAATVHGVGCRAVGATDPQGAAAALALSAGPADAHIRWSGGSIELSGPPGMMSARSGNVAIGLDTLVTPDVAGARTVEPDVAMTGDVTVTGAVGAAYFANDPTAYLTLDSSGPWWVVDGTDRLAFQRASNLFQFITGNAARLSVGPAGIDVAGAVAVAGSQVLAGRKAGWGTITGTASRAGFASYAAPAVGNPPGQSEVQALADHVQTLSQTLKALVDDLSAHGLIGA